MWRGQNRRVFRMSQSSHSQGSIVPSIPASINPPDVAQILLAMVTQDMTDKYVAGSRHRVVPYPMIVARKVHSTNVHASLTYGGEIASPFISLGRGFLRALFAVFDTRGAPWIMRGSFIRLVSSLAGAGHDLVSIEG